LSCPFKAGNKKSSLYRLEKAAWAILILRLLRLLNFFADSLEARPILESRPILDARPILEARPDLDAPLGAAELAVCRLAEHFLRVADDNCHEVCEVDGPPAACLSLADLVAGGDGLQDHVVVVIGVAIYLKSSLFNNRSDSVVLLLLEFFFLQILWSLKKVNIIDS
jgi:hypothetical protein